MWHGLPLSVHVSFICNNQRCLKWDPSNVKNQVYCSAVSLVDLHKVLLNILSYSVYILSYSLLQINIYYHSIWKKKKTVPRICH